MVLVKSVQVDIGVKGDADSKAKLDEITRRAEQLKKAFPEYKLKIESAAAAEKLRVFKGQLADATKDRTATVKVRVDDSALLKFTKKMQAGGGPAWLGPAIALAPAAGTLTGVAGGAAVGLAGAFTAGAGALAAFGAIAKPVLTDAQTASAAVAAAQYADAAAVAKVTSQYQYAMSVAKTKAQRQAAYATEQKGFSNAEIAQNAAVASAYANLSPAQIALSKQLGDMADAWGKVKAAQTPVVAGALQPWLKSVTDLTGKLSPVINAVSPAIGLLGTDVDRLVNSAAFTGFRDFVAGTGSWTVAAAGGTVIDFVKSFIILLPQFTPLIDKAVGGIGGLGPAVLAWSSSKKASDDITKFMTWFTANGPAVSGLLKNIGGALGALAPGLTAGGATELQAMSGFFGLIAKLPPSIAKPLAEVAGAMLILNKLGVVSVGVKLLGPAAGAAGAEAGAGATAGLWSKLLPGVRLAGGALAATVAIDMVLKSTPSGKPGSGANWFDNPFGGSNPSNPVKGSNPNALSSWNQLGADIANIWNSTWNNTITRTAGGFHDLAGWFDKGRHDVSGIWDLTWHNTVDRLNNGMNDTDRLLGGWEHNVAHWFDTARHDIASAWDTAWNNTVGRAQNGVADVARWTGTLPGRVEGAFKGAGGWLAGAGKDVVQGLWNGMTFIWGKVTGWISGLAGWIAKHKGPVSLDRTLLYPAGRALMEGLKVGLLHGFVDIKGIVTGAASDIGGWVMGGGNKILGLGLSGLHGLTGAAKSVWDKLFGGGGSGVQQWAGLVAQALKMEGLPASLAGSVLYQMQTESGGNANAQNNTDVNARMGIPSQGLMQVTPPTFALYHWPGTSWNIRDPLANIAAALNYGEHGRGFGSGPGQIGSGHGYAAGTMSAAPGWARVGERGPEWLRFRGGEQVLPAGTAPPGGGGSTYNITVHAGPLARPADVGREVVGAIRAFERGSGAGWRK